MGSHLMDLVMMVLDDAQRNVIRRYAETDDGTGICFPVDVMHG